jgi:hypothetical protein
VRKRHANVDSDPTVYGRSRGYDDCSVSVNFASAARRKLFRVTGNSESAGINRHVVGDARALRERK